MQPSSSGEGVASAGPLSDVRVIDLGTMVAGPFVATLLGDFGADVIKVELPGSGDAIRSIAPHVEGVPGQWTAMSRNKRCISLDVSKEKGQALLKRLVAVSDILVENFRPGTLEKWGLGFETLKAANPGLVLVRVSGFEQTGPNRHRPGFATVADASLYESAFRMMEPIVVDYGMVGRIRERDARLDQVPGSRIGWGAQRGGLPGAAGHGPGGAGDAEVRRSHLSGPCIL